MSSAGRRWKPRSQPAAVKIVRRDGTARPIWPIPVGAHTREPDARAQALVPAVAAGICPGARLAAFAGCGRLIEDAKRAGYALPALCHTSLAQVLLYPVTNADFETPSYQQFADGYYLTRDGMMWFWDQYTTDPAQRTEVYAAPLQASVDRLSGLPPTLVITDEADVLRDEGEAYAARLRQAGVDVTAVRVLGMVHDFLMLDSLRDCKASNVARQLAVDALKTALQPQSQPQPQS